MDIQKDKVLFKKYERNSIFNLEEICQGEILQIIREPFEDPVFQWKLKYRIQKSLDLDSETAKIVCMKFWVSVKVLIQLLNINKNKKIERLRQKRIDYLKVEKDKEEDKYHEAHLNNYYNQTQKLVPKTSMVDPVNQIDGFSPNGSSLMSFSSRQQSKRYLDKIANEFSQVDNIILENKKWIFAMNIIFFLFWFLAFIFNKILHKDFKPNTAFKVILIVFPLLVFTSSFIAIFLLQKSLLEFYLTAFSFFTFFVNSSFLSFGTLLFFLNKNLFEFFKVFYQ